MNRTVQIAFDKVTKKASLATILVTKHKKEESIILDSRSFLIDNNFKEKQKLIEETLNEFKCDLHIEDERGNVKTNRYEKEIYIRDRSAWKSAI